MHAYNVNRMPLCAYLWIYLCVYPVYHCSSTPLTTGASPHWAARQLGRVTLGLEGASTHLWPSGGVFASRLVYQKVYVGSDR